MKARTQAQGGEAGVWLPQSDPQLEIAIPAELRAWPNWVCYKPDKTPVNPKTGRNARTDNPATWGEFGQAVAFWEAHNAKGIAGIGYAFSADDPYTGVDLDKCRNPQSGKIESWAEAIIIRLNSYTEISPSGTGVHILIRGQVPPGGNKKGKVEMYSNGRYFTMTGQHLEGTPAMIEDRQVELEALHREEFGEAQKSKKAPTRPTITADLSDRELIDRAHQAANREKFAKLWQGDWREYPSQSEADFALCSMLAFWTQGDRVRMDRLFRQSRLCREEKWDRLTGGITYGAMTIESALDGIVKTYQGCNSVPLQRIKRASTILLRSDTQEEEIIGEGILPRGGGLIIAGESGEGKSLLRTELGIHLVMGHKVWGMAIPAARRVLIFQFENTEGNEAYRLKKMLQGLNLTDFPDNLLYSDPTIRLDFGKERGKALAMEIIKESEAEVVIYDPFTSLHCVNENDNVQIRMILDNITEINRKIGTSAILIHHFGKPSENSVTAHRTRGASSIRDWADTLIAVTRKKHEHKILRLLEFIKVRNGPEPQPILLERDEYFLHHVTQKDIVCPPEKVKAILEELGGKVEEKEILKQAIMKATGCNEKSARSYIDNAVVHKAIKCVPNPADKRKSTYSMIKR